MLKKPSGDQARRRKEMERRKAITLLNTLLLIDTILGACYPLTFVTQSGRSVTSADREGRKRNLKELHNLVASREGAASQVGSMLALSVVSGCGT